MSAIARQVAGLQAWIWSESKDRPAWARVGARVLRITVAVTRELLAGQLTLRSMSLVYTTLLSLVPLLAISFSVLKGLGVHNRFQELMLTLLEPMGERGVEVNARVMEFVDNANAGVLGSFGVAVLLWTVVSMVQKVEAAFNYTWHVAAQRSLAQRFSNYLSVILVGPVLVVAALGLTATISSDATVTWLIDLLVLGPVVELLGRLLPYLMIIGAFTFVYIFVPNTRVQLGAALIGGIVAGALWESCGWLFTRIAANSASLELYSAFATLFLFMVWLFLAWLILLVGASIAFFVQNPAYLRRDGRDLQLAIERQERLAFAALYLVAERFSAGAAPWGDRDLARRVHLPEDRLAALLQPLLAAGFLVQSAGESPGYLPARPLEAIRVADVLHCIRAGGDPSAAGRSGAPDVDRLFAQLEGAVAAHLEGVTLATLVDRDRPGDGDRAGPMLE